MDLNIYTIWDQKADAYLNPFFLPNDALALRTFKDCTNDDNHAFGKNPDDYTLFNLGSFNTTTGKFDIHGTPKSLGNGLIVRGATTKGLTHSE